MEDTLIMAKRSKVGMPPIVRTTFYSVQYFAMGFTMLVALVKAAQAANLF